MRRKQATSINKRSVAILPHELAHYQGASQLQRHRPQQRPFIWNRNELSSGDAHRSLAQHSCGDSREQQDRAVTSETATSGCCWVCRRPASPPGLLHPRPCSLSPTRPHLAVNQELMNAYGMN